MEPEITLQANQDHESIINQQDDKNRQEKESEEERMHREELRHRREVKTAFVNYGKDLKQTYQDLFSQKKVQKYYSLARDRKSEEMERAIACNQNFLNKIIQYVNFNEEQELGQSVKNEPFHPLQTTNCQNISKIRTTVKQFFRQWSSETPEAQSYRLLVQKASSYLQKGNRILVPGCGLGRLVLELVEAGFGAQGNQVTYFMLYGSNFILNCCTHQQEFQIYPFIHSYTNMAKQEDIFRSVKIPDKVASEVVQENSDFSMAAGEFTEIYKEEKSSFQGIITCFFLDTANNIFDYIDTIHGLLKSGGIWINYGPLLFHYKDMLDQISVQISWEQLQKYVLSKGFKLMQEQTKKSTYCHDPQSLYTYEYNCLMSVWKK